MTDDKILEYLWRGANVRRRAKGLKRDLTKRETQCFVEAFVAYHEEVKALSEDVK